MINKNTFPKIGRSTDPHVSAAQCTNPDPKSAVIIPQKAAAITTLIRSSRKCLTINARFNIISAIQKHTQIIS